MIDFFLQTKNYFKMKQIFTIERVMIHNENMDFTGVQIRIKLFGHTAISYSLKPTLNII